jgi:hypothetical protein
MSLLPQTYVKRGYFSMVFPLLFVLVVAPKVTNAANSKLVICNDGDISLWVAQLRSFDAFLIDWWQLNGWFEAKPDDCTPEMNGYGISHLVFAQKSADGGFGVVKRRFRSDKNLSENLKLTEICVKSDKLDTTQQSSSGFTPPCSTGWKAVPVSVSLLGKDNTTLTLNVNASKYDAIDVFIREPPKPVTPPTPVRTSVNNEKQSPTAVKRKSPKPRRRRP